MQILFPPVLISLQVWTISALPRFVEMKRPIICMCVCVCVNHTFQIYTVYNCLRNVLTSRRPQSPLSGGYMQADWENTWNKRQNVVQLWRFLKWSTHKSDSLIATFEHTIVPWWQSATPGKQALLLYRASAAPCKVNYGGCSVKLKVICVKREIQLR